MTIYAFSIENFKRSKYEVDALMDMAMIKLKQLLQHGDILDRYGAKIRILGQKELIKPDLRKAIEKAVEMTANNDKAVLNVCFPYTSRDEITSAIRSTVEEWSVPITQPPADREPRSSPQQERIVRTIRSQQHQIEDPQPPASTYLQAPGPYSPSSSVTSLTDDSISSSSTLHGLDSPPSEMDKSPGAAPVILPLSSSSPIYPSPELINSHTLTDHMFTAADPPLDLLIRTSGVERLSDFMLWQCHQQTEIVFLKVLWPEFDLWDFLPVIWEWQWRVRKREKMSREEKEDLPRILKRSERKIR